MTTSFGGPFGGKCDNFAVISIYSLFWNIGAFFVVFLFPHLKSYNVMKNIFSLFIIAKSSSFESISGFQWSSVKTNSPLHVELFVISGSSDILWMPHELQLYCFLYLEFLHHVP